MWHSSINGDAVEIATLIVKSTLEYGILGLVAVMGWTLAVVLLYSDHKRKDKVSQLVEDKEKELNETKDELANTVKELSSHRITDLKELTADYNQLATNVMHTMDRLASALEAKHHDKQ